MLAAVSEALRNLLDLFQTLIRYINPSSNGIQTQYKLWQLGTIIIIMIAISVTFFVIKGIKKMTWGR